MTKADNETVEEPIIEEQESENVTDETLEQDVETESDKSEYEGLDSESLNDETDDDTDEESEDEVIISIGEEAPPQEEESKKAAPWIKELRRKNREQQKELRELKEKLNTNTDTPSVELGEEPTLEDCDYDTDKFKTSFKEWFNKKADFDKQESVKKVEVEKQQQAWQSRLDLYEKDKTNLKVSNKDEAEFTVESSLDKTQLGVIKHAADNAAQLIYVLGINPKKLKELSVIKDPVKFSFAVAKLETTLKIRSKKRPDTSPEKRVNSSGSSLSGSTLTLEKLREEAGKTGNFTKLNDYKRSQKNKET
tara:strand:+ start:4151 stop:5071 length:921 start_codon:yes stop_codon:yes gene_type:complete